MGDDEVVVEETLVLGAVEVARMEATDVNVQDEERCKLTSEKPGKVDEGLGSQKDPDFVAPLEMEASGKFSDPRSAGGETRSLGSREGVPVEPDSVDSTQEGSQLDSWQSVPGLSLAPQPSVAWPLCETQALAHTQPPNPNPNAPLGQGTQLLSGGVGTQFTQWTAQTPRPTPPGEAIVPSPTPSQADPVATHHDQRPDARFSNPGLPLLGLQDGPGPGPDAAPGDLGAGDGGGGLAGASGSRC